MTPRHGTTRTLSVLTVGILRLSLLRFAAEARGELMAILGRLVRGQGGVLNRHYFQYHKGHNCGICAAVCPYGLRVLKKHSAEER